MRREHASKSGPTRDERGKNGAQLISMKEHRLKLEQSRAEHEAEIAREISRERAACQEEERQRAAEVAAQHAEGLEMEVRRASLTLALISLSLTQTLALTQTLTLTLRAPGITPSLITP